jgi:hypothetical protein
MSVAGLWLFISLYPRISVWELRNVVTKVILAAEPDQSPDRAVQNYVKVEDNQEK